MPRKAWLTIETDKTTGDLLWAILHRTGKVRYAVSIPEGELRPFFQALLKEFGKKREVEKATLKMEMVAGEFSAVLSEPGKGFIAQPISRDLAKFINAVSNVLENCQK